MLSGLKMGNKKSIFQFISPVSSSLPLHNSAVTRSCLCRGQRGLSAASPLPAPGPLHRLFHFQMGRRCPCCDFDTSHLLFRFHFSAPESTSVSNRGICQRHSGCVLSSERAGHHPGALLEPRLLACVRPSLSDRCVVLTRSSP